MHKRNKIKVLKQNKNFLGIPEEYSSIETSRYVILPIPYERTSTYGRGSNNGPKAILTASQEVELYDVALGKETYKICGGIATLSPTTFGIKKNGKVLADKLENLASQLINDDKFVITIGGEHTSVVGAIYAHIENFPHLTVVQFDAHCDLRDSYMDDRWNHACAMARVLDKHKGKLVQVGIRSVGPEELNIREENSERLITFYAHDIKENYERISQIIDTLTDFVYVTFDCDVLDPSIIPSTGTPEPGGLSWEWIDKFFAELSHHKKIIGFDISELSPIPNIHYPQFTIAKLIYRIIGYIAKNQH